MYLAIDTIFDHRMIAGTGTICEELIADVRKAVRPSCRSLAALAAA